MSSHASATPLRLEVSPSAQLLRLLLWFHLTSATLVLAQPLEILWQITLVAALAISLHMQRQKLRRRFEVARDSGGEWQWKEEGGKAVAVELMADSYVMPWLVIFNCRERHSRRRHSLVLATDSLPAQQLRRLRVALRQEDTARSQAAGR